MTRLCRLCGERPVSPARIAAHDYRCNRCRHRAVGQRAAVARYKRSALGRATAKRANDKRIMIGRQFHSCASSADLAKQINAHIREKRLAFIARQQNREETESAAAGRVPSEATL